jgi:hypothetical protein
MTCRKHSARGLFLGGLAALGFALAVPAGAQPPAHERTTEGLTVAARPTPDLAIKEGLVIDGAPSVVYGKPAGIEVGQYAIDFELQPAKVHPDFTRWLGDKAPKNTQETVMLSDFVHKAPILLVFGNYT